MSAAVCVREPSLSEAPTAVDGKTSWSYPDPKWMAGVTMIDERGVLDHVARVNTFTTAPFDREREFTGQGVLACMRLPTRPTWT